MEDATVDQKQYVTKNQLAQMRKDLVQDLTTGRILLPQVVATPLNFAGATNHAPNSDHSYSKDAATVPGTLPATAGDGNQEDYHYYRQKQGDNITVDAAHALKAVGHSLYAAAEGANPEIPVWNRTGGWDEMGSETGADAYDVALELFGKIVGADQRWFFGCILGALSPEIIAAGIQFYVGLWIKAGAYEGWAKGGPFDLTSRITGTVGTHNLNYRVLAKTDSGVSILSNVLNVPNGPNVLSENDWVTIFFNPGNDSGFIDFTIIREDAGVFAKIGSVRNSIDLQFLDVGKAGEVVSGWPADPGNFPLAFAQTRTLKIGPYGSTWLFNELSIKVPSTFNFALVDNDGMFLRFGFTAPTAVNRQVGVDQLMWSTQRGAWAPDLLPPFPDGTRPVPTISPTSSTQGGNGGLHEPPDPGTGGGRCIRTRMPVLVKDRWQTHFKRFKSIGYQDRIKGEHREPYQVLRKESGMVASYYVLRTANGITYECNARHELIRDIYTRSTIQAQQIVAGETRIASWVKGRKTKTLVVSKTLVPKPAEVGTLSLHHPQGLSPNGRGMYVAGFSKRSDRGLFSSNVKEFLELGF